MSSLALSRFKGSSQQHRVEGGFLRPRFHWTIDWRGRRGPDRKKWVLNVS